MSALHGKAAPSRRTGNETSRDDASGLFEAEVAARPGANESASAEPAEIEPSETTPRNRSRARIVLPALLALVVAGAGGAYILGRGKESTDDAFVEGHVANVAARVPGAVARVLIKDNQLVEVGDVLVELDDRDAKARLITAQADLESARASLVASERQLAFIHRTVESNLLQAQGNLTQASAGTQSADASVEQARADISAAQSRRDFAKLDFDRASKLRSEDAVAQTEVDAKKALLDQADAALLQARARLTMAQTGIRNAYGGAESAKGRLVGAKTGPEQIDIAEAQVGVAKARVHQTEATLEQAELNLTYATIRAPFRGTIARRTVEPGQMVAPERPLLSVVAADDVWVVANFKEDQIADMRPGAQARLTIDTFGGREFQGHVESIAKGSGARFALLPPDNASGNFTKVVQRFPVLVRLDASDGTVSLRAGMSANVTVRTR